MCNGTETIFQIGKDGVNDNQLAQIRAALEARELIKLRVLDSAPYTAREACDEICAAVEGEPVQVIGTRFCIYKRAEKPENRRIKLV